MTKKEVINEVAAAKIALEAAVSSGAPSGKERERLKNTMATYAAEILKAMEDGGATEEDIDEAVKPLEAKIAEMKEEIEVLEDALAEADNKYKHIKYLLSEKGIDTDALLREEMSAAAEDEAGAPKPKGKTGKK